MHGAAAGEGHLRRRRRDVGGGEVVDLRGARVELRVAHEHVHADGVLRVLELRVEEVPVARTDVHAAPGETAAHHRPVEPASARRRGDVGLREGEVLVALVAHEDLREARRDGRHVRARERVGPRDLVVELAPVDELQRRVVARRRRADLQLAGVTARLPELEPEGRCLPGRTEGDLRLHDLPGVVLRAPRDVEEVRRGRASLAPPREGRLEVHRVALPPLARRGGPRRVALHRHDDGDRVPLAVLADRGALEVDELLDLPARRLRGLHELRLQVAHPLALALAALVVGPRLDLVGGLRGEGEGRRPREEALEAPGRERAKHRRGARVGELQREPVEGSAVLDAGHVDGHGDGPHRVALGPAVVLPLDHHGVLEEVVVLVAVHRRGLVAHLRRPLAQRRVDGGEGAPRALQLEGSARRRGVPGGDAAAEGDGAALEDVGGHRGMGSAPAITPGRASPG